MVYMAGVYQVCLKQVCIFLYFNNKKNIQRQLKHHNSSLDKKDKCFCGEQPIVF